MRKYSKMEKTLDFIHIVNLTKTYLEGDQTRLVLDNLSLDLYKGEFIAILGKSGSGKSTLLNILSGIDQPDHGEIWVNSQNLSQMAERSRTLFRRKEIGFVFQFFNLLPTLTAGENVTLPLELNGVPYERARNSALKLLVQVGLEDRWDTYPDRLSGGEQQRVAIARALVHNPSIILADEPTGNLDEDTGAQILSLLDTLSRKAGKNLIMVTHSMEAAHIADRTFTLHEGKLAELNREIEVPL
jgi:putative ABC transport system ATP-binding protein